MKTYTFTEDAITNTLDYANGERNTIDLENCELLPEGGRWLTRDDVERVLERVTMDRDIEEVLDELFGEEK